MRLTITVTRRIAGALASTFTLPPHITAIGTADPDMSTIGITAGNMTRPLENIIEFAVLGLGQLVIDYNVRQLAMLGRGLTPISHRSSRSVGDHRLYRANDFDLVEQLGLKPMICRASLKMIAGLCRRTIERLGEDQEPQASGLSTGAGSVL